MLFNSNTLLGSITSKPPNLQAHINSYNGEWTKQFREVMYARNLTSIGCLPAKENERLTNKTDGDKWEEMMKVMKIYNGDIIGMRKISKQGDKKTRDFLPRREVLI